MAAEVYDKLNSGTSRERKVWTREWLAARKKISIYQDIEAEDEEKFCNAFHMSKVKFEELFQHVKQRIEKESTVMRQPVPARTRLQVGENFL